MRSNQNLVRQLPVAQLLLWCAPLVFLAAFYFYPLGSILRLSLERGSSGTGRSLLAALTAPAILRVLWFTVWQAAASTLLTLLVGLPGAYLLARFDFRGKTLLQALTGIPFVMPTLVVAAAFNALLGPHGWLNLGLMALLNLADPPLHITNSLAAILIAHVFYNTTIVLRMVGDFWSHLDPRLNQAARTLGTNPWQTLFQITLPLLLPVIAAAALLVFIIDFTSFGVILILGGPRFTTLEVEIYNQTIGFFNLPLAAALSMLQLACTLVLTVTYTRLSHHLTRPLALRSRRHTQRRLLSRRSRVLAVGLILLLLTLLTTPLIALAVRSVTYIGAAGREVPRPGESASAPNQPGFTLAYYRELTINRRGSLFYAPPLVAISISFGYALATVALALALGFPAAWALARAPAQSRGAALLNRWLDPLLMLPLGTSAVTLGLGFIVALNRPPLDLRASPLLIPLAHTLVAFPFVVRSLTPALHSIQPRLRAAAALLGAPPFQVLRYIDLPLIGRAILVAATFAFTISLGEFGATALIARPEFPTIPVAIYRLLSQPGAMNVGQAMALSTLLMALSAVGMLAIERFRIADVGEF